jgi:hypothetical protein
MPIVGQFSMPIDTLRVERPLTAALNRLTASKSVRAFTECEHAKISIFAWYVGKMSTYHAK